MICDHVMIAVRRRPSIVISKLHVQLSRTRIQRGNGVEGRPCNDHPFRFVSGKATGSVEGQPVDTSNRSIASLYLHVGPSGDFWTGHSIFAAKHLQPDYVKSVRLAEDMDVDALLELLEEDSDGVRWTRAIYDNGNFPDDLLDRLDDKASKV